MRDALLHFGLYFNITLNLILTYRLLYALRREMQRERYRALREYARASGAYSTSGYPVKGGDAKR